MKNLFKFGFLALAISFSITACGSNQSASSADSEGTDIDSAVTNAADTTRATETDPVPATE